MDKLIQFQRVIIDQLLFASMKSINLMFQLRKSDGVVKSLPDEIQQLRQPKILKKTVNNELNRFPSITSNHKDFKLTSSKNGLKFVKMYRKQDGAQNQILCSGTKKSIRTSTQRSTNQVQSGIYNQKSECLFNNQIIRNQIKEIRHKYSRSQSKSDYVSSLPLKIQLSKTKQQQKQQIQNNRVQTESMSSDNKNYMVFCNYLYLKNRKVNKALGEKVKLIMFKNSEMRTGEEGLAIKSF